MLGRATALLEPGATQLLRRTWGIAEIHTRQKWSAIWPLLSQMPSTELRVLDAGCGIGRWTLELALRRPNWFVHGIDKDAGSIQKAKRLLQRSGVNNVQFDEADFLQFAPEKPYDLVLSVASAHYLAGAGNGQTLFRKFSEWLEPGGELVLYGPRAKEERPETTHLESLGDNWAFRATDLYYLTNEAGMRVDTLQPRVWKFGTLAKQIAKSAGGSLLARVASYPLQLALSAMDRDQTTDHHIRSAAWLLIATKP